tara:strand:- start:43 stop:447 length:405 start_codon:yes stop_codon:yes gene_type:complete
MSTILANTITAVGGGGTNVKVGNNATFISDGGTVTDSNLVQALVKVWIKTPADGASVSDSYNVSSATDSATGQVIVNINNNMANANYAIGMSTLTNVDQTLIVSDATGSYDMRTYNGSSYVDIGMRTMVAGDLA